MLGSSSSRRGNAGPQRPENMTINSTRNEVMPTKLREILAMGLFLVLASYVGFSAIRLGLLLWQRIA